MALIRSRIAEHPYRCPFCEHLVHVGEVIAQVVVGSTYSSGCVGCSWKAVNKALPSQQKAAT